LAEKLGESTGRVTKGTVPTIVGQKKTGYKKGRLLEAGKRGSTFLCTRE